MGLATSVLTYDELVTHPTWYIPHGVHTIGIMITSQNYYGMNNWTNYIPLTSTNLYQVVGTYVSSQLANKLSNGNTYNKSVSKTINLPKLITSLHAEYEQATLLVFFKYHPDFGSCSIAVGC